MLAELSVKSVVYHGGEMLVKLWEGTDRSVIFLVVLSGPLIYRSQ